MKKIKNFVLGILLTALLIPIGVNAASGSVSISTSGKAVVGSTITATVTISSGSPLGSWDILVNYDSSRLRLVSGANHIVGYVENGNTKSRSFTLKFQALASGNAYINVGSYQVYAYDESMMGISPRNASIRIMTQAELEATYSKDNNLKALSVEGYELSPEFNKDTLEYEVTVPSTVDKVNIIATKNDSTATVEGAGEKEVVEGANPFEIVVTAQNGTTKTYKITVTVEDLNPIEAKIGNGSYTIVKRKDNLEAPTGFDEATVTIGEFEIPAFKSEVLGITVVGIRDEEGNIFYAIYDNGKYTLYNELNSNSITIYTLPLKDDLKGFVKTTIKINGMEVEVYKLNKSSKFSIVYGKNVETGKESYYMYDEEEHTFQRYNQEYIESLQKDLQNYLYVIYAFGGALLLICFCFIITKSAKRKARKKAKAKKVEKTDEQKEMIADFLDENKKDKKKKN